MFCIASVSVFYWEGILFQNIVLYEIMEYQT
jgi:hypothetical protein